MGNGNHRHLTSVRENGRVKLGSGLKSILTDTNASCSKPRGSVLDYASPLAF
jgi:hypothetical protein